MNTNEMIELADLEPADDVKGGGIGVDAGGLTLSGVISGAASTDRGVIHPGDTASFTFTVTNNG